MGSPGERLAFAGGAVLTMLADTMMPEAFEHGGRLVGLFTTVGFAIAFALRPSNSRCPRGIPRFIPPGRCGSRFWR